MTLSKKEALVLAKLSGFSGVEEVFAIGTCPYNPHGNPCLKEPAYLIVFHKWVLSPCKKHALGYIEQGAVEL